jgi:hypothetical protein
VDIDMDRPPEKPASNPKNKKDPAPRVRDPWKDDFDPPHKQVDFNAMCLAILEYRDRKFDECPPNADFGNKDCGCQDYCEAYYKREAAEDIIALLHTRL